MRKRYLMGLGAIKVSAIAVVALTRLGKGDEQQQSPQQPPAAGSVALAASDTARLKGPRQPIFFRHDVHAGQLKMRCQYCHYSAAVSSEPGIPSMQTCMGCHIGVPGKSAQNKAEIKKLTAAWSKKQPVEWVRVHAVARFVRFPHSQHIKALGPEACATCHGNVARMPQVYKANNVNNMGFCVQCHMERKVTRDCTACHY